MALNLDELMIGDIILNDEGKPCVVEGLYRNQIYTNKGVYLPFEVDPMPLSKGFLLRNGFTIVENTSAYTVFQWGDHYHAGEKYVGIIKVTNYISNFYEECGFTPWAIYIEGTGGTYEITNENEEPQILNIQHVIKQANIKLTLTCQQSS